MEKRRFISISLILLLVLSISSVYGADEITFSEDSMYSWLQSQTSDGSYNSGDIMSTAWVAIASAKSNLVTEADQTLSWLNNNMNAQNCWPAQSCLTTETALVALATYMSNQDTSPIENYFKNSMIGSTTGGVWMLEVITPSNGTCKISYTINEEIEEKIVTVSSGKFPGCGNTNFLDLNTCLRTNLIQNNPNLNMNIDCSEIDTITSITLVYRSGNSFYIVSSDDTNIVDITIPNGCFGRGVGDRCNKESSFYGAWVLNEINSPLDISVYLREAYEENNPLHNIVLYLISKDTQYLSKLKKLQSTDGSLGKNVLLTSLAAKVWNDDPSTYEIDIQEATRYIENRQTTEGGINNNVVDTSSAIYGVYGFGASSTATCSDGIKNGDERGIDCGGVCEAYGYDCCDNNEIDDEENGYDCGGVCPECNLGTETCNLNGICDANENNAVCPSDCTEEKSPCVINGVCESEYGESKENCADDCKDEPVVTPDVTSVDTCGDSICGSTEDESSCSEDCKTDSGSSFGTIILILIILALLGGGGYFAYTKGWIKLPSGGKPKSSPQPYRPFSERLPPPRPVAPPQQRGFTRSATRPAPKPRSGPSKLDQSIEEAKKLLGK